MVRRSHEEWSRKRKWVGLSSRKEPSEDAGAGCRLWVARELGCMKRRGVGLGSCWGGQQGSERAQARLWPSPEEAEGGGYAELVREVPSGEGWPLS